MSASTAAKSTEGVGKGEHAAQTGGCPVGDQPQSSVRLQTKANAPEAVLLDEPTSALDEVSARAIEELLLSIVHERRMTCVIVTHNRPQALRLVPRTLVLEAGRLAAIGPTEEVLHAY